VTSSGVFDYSLSSVHGVHHPNRESPVRFTLIKPGVLEPLDKIVSRDFRMARDGTPLEIVVDREQRHKVILKCWNNELQRPGTQRQYDWRFEIAIVNGGLIPSAGKDTIAPQDGYSPSERIEMPASLPPQQWSASIQRSFFIRFNDGVFSHASIEMHARGDHFVTWESVLNPKAGSRNLEQAP
jgi:hypothetical protein